MLSCDSRKGRQIEKPTRTDGDRGDEGHASFIRSGSTCVYAVCVDVPIRPARVIANRVDVSICPKVELS